MKQVVTSAETSRPQVSRGIRVALKHAAPWEQVILDFGAGKYNYARLAVTEAGHFYLAYDPYNLPEAENRYSIAIACKHVDIIVCANVLNVLDSAMVTHEVLCQINLIASKNTTIIFTVWEGDKSGSGKYTRNGFQANKKLKQYLPLVKMHFNNAEIHENAIFATK